MSAENTVTCPACKGTGEAQVYSDTFGIIYPTTCSLCDGSGEISASYMAWLKRGARVNEINLDKGIQRLGN